MRRILFALALILAPFGAFAWEQKPPRDINTCAKDAPFGLPTIRQGQNVICRAAYVLANDPIAKIPQWVAYTLTPDEAVGCVPRTNAFAADASVPKGQRAELEDYAKSGYDIGHIANAADMAFSEETMQESFLLTNMSPQLPGLNRGIWKVLESSERAWAYNYKHIYTVYAGNIWSAGSKTIGPNRVVVPDYIYKILIDNQTGEVQAFLFSHREGQGTDLAVVLSTVAQIEQLAGVKFPVPQTHNKASKPATPWPADLKAVADAKKAKCKAAD